jgi:hypothetical protein
MCMCGCSMVCVDCLFVCDQSLRWCSRSVQLACSPQLSHLLLTHLLLLFSLSLSSLSLSNSLFRTLELSNSPSRFFFFPCLLLRQTPSSNAWLSLAEGQPITPLTAALSHRWGRRDWVLYLLQWCVIHSSHPLRHPHVPAPIYFLPLRVHVSSPSRLPRASEPTPYLLLSSSCSSLSLELSRSRTLCAIQLTCAQSLSLTHVHTYHTYLSCIHTHTLSLSLSLEVSNS